MQWSDDVERAVHDPIRLRAVERSGLVEQATASFDGLARLAQLILGVPTTFLSVVEERRDFYLGTSGLGEPLHTSRAITGLTFCHLTIATGSPLVIGDTRLDPMHRAVPTVELLGVAAYLGVPVRLPDQQILGAFCAIDHEPRAWTEFEREVMTGLAHAAEREIALRDAEAVAAELRRTVDELGRSQWLIERMQEIIPLCMICQRVLNHGGDWEPLVELLARGGIVVSHGYCPSCAPTAFE